MVKVSALCEGNLPLWLAESSLASHPRLVLTLDAEEAVRLQAAVGFFAPALKTVYFPDWETLPYERFSPHQDLVSERQAALWQWHNGGADMLFVPVATAMQLLPPVAFMAARTFFLKEGQKLEVDRLREVLVAAGYAHVTHVVAAGEFALRGGIVDIFAMGADEPFRLDLFDDEIETIKTFDPDTQRTLERVAQIRLLPAHEFPSDEAAQNLFRRRFREEIDSSPSAATVYQAVGKGQFGAGVEYYWPLFFEEAPASFFDYAPADTEIVCVGDVWQRAGQVWADIKSRYRMAGGDPAYPPLPPGHLFASEDGFGAALNRFAQVRVSTEDGRFRLPEVAVDRRQPMPLAALQDFVREFPGRVLVCAETLGRRETMQAFLQQHGLRATAVPDWHSFAVGEMALGIVAAPLTQGFRLPERALAVVTEADLYRHLTRLSPMRRRKHKAVSDTALRDLAEISIGDPVVHEEHGIGRYQGLVSMDVGGEAAEMMLLEYANQAQLYVPVAQLHLISRYAGHAYENVTLHALGGSQWGKARRKAAEKARDTAAELLNLYAQRALQQGHAFSLNEADYAVFADGFGYEETEDQAAAIGAVIRDLVSGKPMDRLICGDVGFGKTEVALRAAFVAVMGGKQVAMLAPTTLLVEQHAQNFSDRFADFPVKIAQLSRFNSSKETRAALEGIADGTVDIVIGTHKLISPDIAFKNLGLVIIDEEHRFGVRQKEELKRLRANVDVLTLTATPIPRTLSMALEGLRDFSLITTAPSRRLAVKTFVKPFGEGIIREAVERELKRGGQVFFLHNEVETMDNMYEKLAALLPQARIGVAHGQLRERELEQVMRDFHRQQFNVLLCSTIIETGIDIPNANTIIIHRADKFGLAQLHQLRGRVGRSHHQAYAYLLTPEHISRDAEKRLDAIAAADDLGAGFALAMQDLEIRGAGEILGEGQSGEMMQVGFTLYAQMLKQTVRALKKGHVPDLDAPLGVATDIKLHSPALLPESYCPDVHERLVLYKRLAVCDTEAEIDQVYEELIDRFGLPESPVKTLIESHRLRLSAKALGITALDAGSEAVTFTFGKHHTLDPVELIGLIQRHKHYSLVGQDKLRVKVLMEDIDTRIRTVKTLLQQLAALGEGSQARRA